MDKFDESTKSQTWTHTIKKRLFSNDNKQTAEKNGTLYQKNVANIKSSIPTLGNIRKLIVKLSIEQSEQNTLRHA